SRAAPLRAILQRDKPAALSSGMKDAIKPVNFWKTCLAVMIDGKGLKSGMKQAPMATPMSGYAKKLEDVEALAFQLDLTASVDLAVMLQCKDQDTAEQLKKDALDGIGAMRLTLNPMPAESSRDLLKMLDSVQATTSGSRATVSLSISADSLVAMSKNAPGA